MYHSGFMRARPKLTRKSGRSPGQKSVRFTDHEMTAIDFVMKKYGMTLAGVAREVLLRVVRELIPPALQSSLPQKRFTDASSKILRDYRTATKLDTGTDRLAGTE